MIRSYVLWFTGLSGSGKSTIAKHLHMFLKKKGIPSEILDGDLLRQAYANDLGFTKTDRNKNIDRAIFLAQKLQKEAKLILATFISPYQQQRQKAKDQLENFIEIYVNTPLEVCEKRDVKGLYKLARSKKIQYFTGISDTYEIPISPDIEVHTENVSVSESTQTIIQYLRNRAIING